MATSDITRDAFERSKRFSAVWMQEGRVLTDDDFNDAERIRVDDDAVTRVHTIGPVGSPDDGFRIRNPRIDGSLIDFDILAGTYYVGGQRIILEEDQTFQLQTDWLHNPGTAAPTIDRLDLVYLEVWPQPVSAIEDEELFERALGGPDTTTRARLMARVRVLENVSSDDCGEAWKEAEAVWTGAGLGTLDSSHELIPDTRLSVTALPGGDPDNLCSPTAAAGYLGAENQAIRVQIVDDTHISWGFENAAPLYRVRLAADGLTITLDTDPKDEAHWVAAGQIVELLPWSAVLSNGEKIAEELKPGHLAKVQIPYDPDLRQIVLDPAFVVTPGFGMEWQGRADAADLETTRYGQVDLDAPYLFMRVWDRGMDRTSEPAVALVGNAATLGTTNLRVEFTGTDRRANDFFVIAARPFTPDVVVPWQLETGRAPHGVHRFMAPMSIIRWPAGGEPSVHDCRPTFRSLTHDKGCCRYTVGDDNLSHGDYSSIQDAVEALPPAGGQICVLPGVHEGPVTIRDRDSVHIHGCGRRSIVHIEGDSLEPVFLIEESRDIKLDSMRILATAERAVEVRPGEINISDRGTFRIPCEKISLEDLFVSARDGHAIFCSFVEGLLLRGCEIDAGPFAEVRTDPPALGYQNAVFVQGNDLLIEESRIEAHGENPHLMPMGGIQVGGGSTRVELRRNLIRGGLGTGVVLGSYSMVPSSVAGSIEVLMTYYDGQYVEATGYAITINEFGCLEYDPVPGDPGGDPADPLVPVSHGDLEELRIIDNDIQMMGTNGIGVVRFFDLAEEELVTTNRLTIEGNRIRECLRIEIKPFDQGLRQIASYGGVALADGELIEIRGNTIEDIGVRFATPACGIYILRGEGIGINNNRIIRNGQVALPDTPIAPGIRGGIVISGVLPPTEELSSPQSGASLRQDGTPALRIHENVIVASSGRAIQTVGIGPMSINDNQLTAHGSDFRLEEVIRGIVEGLGLRKEAEEPDDDEISNRLNPLIDLLGGEVILVINGGMTSEFGVVPASLRTVGSTFPDLEESARLKSAALLSNGKVLFNDNQVHLDALGPAATLRFSAVSIISMDDVGIADNQFVADLYNDFLVTNLLSLGLVSTRTVNNRMTEGLPNALFSILSAGLINGTHGNQTTHCIYAAGLPLPGLTLVTPNQVLISAFLESFCSTLNQYLGGFSLATGLLRVDT